MDTLKFMTQPKTEILLNTVVRSSLDKIADWLRHDAWSEFQKTDVPRVLGQPISYSDWVVLQIELMADGLREIPDPYDNV